VTGREFSEVDIDLLADYVGGALDGTPEEATVARRVADDPEWAEAYAALSAATSSIQADLAAWGATPEPMPTEVADRITTALEQQPSRPALSVVHDVNGPRRSVSRPRRRWPAWATPAAVAAGLVAFAGLGIGLSNSSSNDDAGSSSADAPAVARDNAAGGSAQEAAPQEVVVSGRDYRAATLGTAQPPLADAQALNSPMTTFEGDRAQMAASAQLRRLTTPAALSECLEAIARDHNRGATTVQVVDLASFDGSPAVVVFFTDGSGARWVWASGPNCGQAAWGADTRGKAQIG
jgi:negative regulator of sigma E activity